MKMSETEYTVHPHLRSRWDAVGRKLRFIATTKGEWETWREATSAKLKELTGYNTMVGSELQPKITDEVVFDDYIRQRVEINTEPDVVMTLYVMIPTTGTPPFPAVLAPHGHGSGGKYSVAGITDHGDDIANAVKHYNYDYGIQFARAGFITFCPDARGFGERQEEGAKNSILNSSCQLINNMALPLGQTVTGMWAWDLHRLIDYVEMRDDARSEGVGCGGLSGGGLQTLWASALDERITCSVVSGYMYGYRESLLDLHGNCSCNYVPHLYEYVDMGDIAALIAPRPLLVETGDQDPLNGASGVANTESQVDIACRAFRLLGTEDSLSHDIFEGEHRWNGVEAIPWMVKHLQ